MADLKDIDLAVKTIKKYHKKFVILKCTSKYPAKYEDLNLKMIGKLKKKYKCPVDSSDHTMDNLASIISVTQGASVVEKHFKIENDNKSVDSHFSTPISNYGKIRDLINSVNNIIGNDKSAFKLSNELIKSRRSLYVSKDIKKFESISFKNIKSIRPGFGMHPKFLKKIIGKNAKRNLKKGTPLLKKDIYD